MGRGSIVLGAVAIALLAAAALAGCGGDSGDSSVTTSELSKEAFVKKADAICKQGIERMQHGFAVYLKKNKKSILALRNPSKSDYDALILGVLVPAVEREIREIRKLGAPSGDEDRIEEMLVALEEGVEVAKDDPKAVRSSSEAIFGIASRLAKEYGLEACGSR